MKSQKKIGRVEEGFDGGLYTLGEAKEKKGKYQYIISQADDEITRLKSLRRGFTTEEVEGLRQELISLRDRNLRNTTFDEIADLVARLGIKVYPSEDLKSRRISCELNIKDVGEQVGVAKEVYGRPCRSRTCDTLIKSHDVS